MKTTPRLLLTTILALTASACVDPPKGEPLGFDVVAGDWEGNGVSLAISDTGTIHYNKTGGTNTKLDGMTITDLTTTGFDVKVFGIGTHFSIEALPHDVGGAKKMTVDGTELTLRTTPAEAAATGDAPSGPAHVPLKVPADTVLPPTGTLASLVGVWSGPGMDLSISDDGTLHYERTGLANRKVSGAKVDNVTATGFDMGMMGISSSFVVDKPPAIVDGVVTMTVDGVVLTRR